MAKKIAACLDWLLGFNGCLMIAVATLQIVSRANSGIGLGTWSSKLKDGYYVTVQSKAANKHRFYIMPVNESLKKPKGSTPSGIESGKVYTIKSKGNGTLYMAPQGGDLGSNAPGTLAKGARDTTQRWYLKEAGNGSFQIINLASNKALHVVNKQRHNGTGVVMAARNASNNSQNWWIRKNSDGSMSFVNRFNGLTLSASSLANGSTLVTNYKPSAKLKNFNVAKTNPMHEGVYEMALTAKNSQAVSLSGNSVAANKQLKIFAYDGALTQKFFMKKLSDGTYAIRSQYSARYLADKGGKIVQDVYTQGDAQKWEPVFKDNYFVLRNVATGDYLRTAGAKVANNTLLVTGSAGHPLSLIERHTIDDGAYIIQNAGNSNRVLGANSKKPEAAGAKAYVYKSNDALSQKYQITYVGRDGSGEEMYKIVNIGSTMALTSSGSNITQQKYAGAASQKWKLDISHYGGVVFVNKATGKTIHSNGVDKNVSGAAPKTNTNVDRWTFKKTTSISGLGLAALKRVNATYSKTNFAIAVNLSKHYFWVFSRANQSAPWDVKYEWRCSNGKKATPTFAVNKLLSGAKRYKNARKKADGTYHTTDFYYLTYVGSGQYIHTPLYKIGSKTKYKDKRMGKAISGGCVRVLRENAIWVYHNIKKGTRCIMYY